MTERTGPACMGCLLITGIFVILALLAVSRP